MIVSIKNWRQFIADLIPLLWPESGHVGCGLLPFVQVNLISPQPKFQEVLWLNMNIQSVQELTDRGSSPSGSWTLPLHSSLLRLFTLSSSSCQSAEAQTGFSVPDSTLGCPPAGPVLKEWKGTPCWRNLNVAFFCFDLSATSHL